MARKAKTAPAPKVYRINREARDHACDIMGLLDPICHFLDCDMEIREEVYDAIIAVKRRIEYKKERHAWGYRPKVTLKQLDLVNGFVSNNW